MAGGVSQAPLSFTSLIRFCFKSERLSKFHVVISNCLFTGLRNAVLLKAKRPARSTYISAMPFVDSIHGRPSHACATTAAAHLPASDTSGQVSLYSTDWDTNADELNPLAISHTPMDISHKPPGIV